MKYSRFATRLNDRLRELDRSATWLARRLQVHPATVTRWCAGETRPNSPELIIRIADILSLSDPTSRQHLLCDAGYGYPSSPTSTPSSSESATPRTHSAASQPERLPHPPTHAVLPGGHPLDLPPPLASHFEQLRQQIRESVVGTARAIALWRLETMEWTFRQQRPDVAWMSANLDWFQRALPDFVPLFAALLWHPIVREMLWYKGETTYRTFYYLLGPWQPPE